MIRPAVAADIPAMVRMAGSFHAAVPSLTRVPFSDMTAAATARLTLANPRALALILDLGAAVGMLVAHETDYPCGPAVFATEDLFWIDREHRGHWAMPMLAAYEEWARTRGAMLVGMVCFNDGRTHRLMERAGFAATELNFVKAI